MQRGIACDGLENDACLGGRGAGGEGAHMDTVTDNGQQWQGVGGRQGAHCADGGYWGVT